MPMTYIHNYVDAVTMEKASVTCYQSKKFIFAVEDLIGNRHKVLQVLFGKKDGTVYATFPYFKYKQGLITRVRLPTSHPKGDISLEENGKVTSKIVKFAHHPSGEAHFSLSGQVRTEIKKLDMPLHRAEGHLFSFYFRELTQFDLVTDNDMNKQNLNQTVLTFKLGESDLSGYRIVAWWQKASTLLHKAITSHHGPTVTFRTNNNVITEGFLTNQPQGWPLEDYVLLVTCQEALQDDTSRNPLQIFIAGFHSPFEPFGQSTSLLSALYPANDYELLLKKLGSIDLDAGSSNK